MRFTLPEPFPLLNVQQRKHYRRRAAEKRRTAALIASILGSERPAQPFERARIEVVRYSCGSPDTDGLFGGVKDLLDCLTTPSLRADGSVRNKYGIGVIVDDSPRHIDLDVRSVRCKRAEARTEIMVTEIVVAEVMA
ncbi:hypothetical protein Amme_076_011 [Acidomonas methanolica NBRC 104435]|uniref:Uncharacterized protein n=1 Tax=Acidomonas methanolica NBRC 104435 TaxID=1231351 RepID=A0A023D6E6_ACIMT|nr:hypothetical protein Amme_076_011 [Acidomonas methanolica NBRC 104435]GEL00044.1 hypothetical protein AME01nite_25420 [Acidomonas methanolica NBRC 104435]